MRKTLVLTALLILPIAPAFADQMPAADDGAKLSVKQHLTKMMLSDESFVKKAAVAGRAEIELSKLALEKTSTPQIREFAQRMVKDHTAAATELKTIAQSKNIAVPSELDKEHEQTAEKLRNLNGADFDAAYVDAMQKDHEKAVNLFTAAAADEKLDKQLQQFASKTLPILRGHQHDVHGMEGANVSSTK